jgi:membrane protease subunit HflC
MKQSFEGIARTQRGEGDAKRRSSSRPSARSTEIIAKAHADAQRIRGEGDATAAAIYATAYNRNPEFYSFYRSLQAYRIRSARIAT